MRAVAFLTTIFILLNSISLAQTNFENGFKAGYSNGFCYNQTNCLPPSIPLTPALRIGESNDSYRDGYNRGFQMGLNQNGSNMTRGYKTASSIPMNYVHRIDINAYLNTLKAVDERITKLKQYRSELLSWMQNLNLKVSESIFNTNVLKLYTELNSLNPEDDLVGFSKKADYLNSIREKVIFEIDTYNLRIQSNNSLSNDYNNALGLVQEAHNLIKQGKNDMAFAKLSEALNISQQISFAYALRGYLYFSFFNDYQKSIEDFSKRIDLEKTDTLSFYYRGLANMKLKKHDLAISDFSQAISLNKQFYDCYLQRAICETNLNEIQDAIKDYTELYKNKQGLSQKTFALVCNNLGYSYLQLKQFKNARVYIDEALNIDVDSWYIWDSRGELNFLEGKYSLCIKDMTQAIKIKEDANSYFFRGLAKIKTQKNSDGCTDLKKAFELGDNRAELQIKMNCK